MQDPKESVHKYFSVSQQLKRGGWQVVQAKFMTYPQFLSFYSGIILTGGNMSIFESKHPRRLRPLVLFPSNGDMGSSTNRCKTRKAT